MACFKAVCVLFMCIMVAAPLIIIDAAMPCPKLEAALAPCLPYLKQGGTPVKGCCDGVKTMVSSAKTTVDRQGACKCLKTVAGTIQGINPDYAAKLPSQCGVNIPYKISTSTNCASVK